MGWSNVAGGVLSAITVIITTGTPNSGIFLYNGTPATGNLIGSWAAAAGTDAYSNTYSEGITVGSTAGAHFIMSALAQTLSTFGTTAVLNSQWDPSNSKFTFLENTVLEFTQWNGNSLKFGDLTTAGVLPTSTQVLNAAELLGSAGTIELLSGITAGLPDQATLTLNSGAANGTTGSGLVPAVVITDSATNSPVDVYLPGTAIKTTNTSVPYTWQAATITGTGWAIGPTLGTTQSLQYRFDTEDNLVMIGAVHSTTNAPTNPIFTLPAAYRPATEQRVGCITNAANVATARFVQITASGNVNCFALPTAASTDLQIALTVPMGHIA